MSAFYDLSKTPRNILNQAIVKAIVAENNGALFDPSDLSTLYQDAAGTTPVTAVEQPVGLMLDKAQGMMLGPELVIGGDFSAGTAGFTSPYNATVSVIDGRLRVTATGTNPYAQKLLSSVVGKYYKVSIDIYAGTSSLSSPMQLVIASTSTPIGNSDLFLASNIGLTYKRYELIVLATTTTIAIRVRSGNTPIGTYFELDNVSVKELYGYHATQSITASRPTLSARYNLLIKTEDFADSVWAKNSVEVQTDVAIAPNGTMSADRMWASSGAIITGNDSVGQVGNVTVASKGAPYTLSFYAKAKEINYIRVRESANTGARVKINLTDGSFSGENGWNESIFTVKTSSAENGFLRIEMTRTAPVTFSLSIKCGNDVGAGISESVYIWGADLRLGTNPGPYQRVNTATDYDTDERYFKKYLRFDGVDDYLNLPYMGLYANGSASVVMAKSANYQTDSPSFLAETSSVSATPTYQLLGGIIQPYGLGAYIRNDAGTTVANTKSVLSADVQSAAHITTMVDNGSLIKRFNNSSNVDSDSYARINPLTVDRTVVGAFYAGESIYNKAVMNLYGLIITKSALTDSQRVACERFLAQKAGITL